MLMCAVEVEVTLLWIESGAGSWGESGSVRKDAAETHSQARKHSSHVLEA